jgi:hypothetical protein
MEPASVSASTTASVADYCICPELRRRREAGLLEVAVRIKLQ